MSQPQEQEEEQPLRVAILDGHGLMRDALSRILHQDGVATVVSSSEREEFLSQLQGNHADVAVIDGAFVLDGAGSHAGLLRQLVERFPALRPVILSELSDSAVIDHCLQAGAWAYLFKQDATCQVVVSALRAVARGERLVPMNLLSNQVQQPRSANALSRLTPREREVLALLAAGADNMTISTRLGISERTVKGYTAALYQKLGADNRVLLAIKARELGMTPAVL